MTSPFLLPAITLLVASSVIAIPGHSDIHHHHSHRVRNVGPSNTNLISYHPPSVFKTFGVNGAGLSSTGTLEEVAKSFLCDQLGVTVDALTRHAGHSNDGVSYEYFAQTINGLIVANAVANVAIKDGKVVSYGASLIKPKNVAAKEPTLNWERAILWAEEAVGGKWNQGPTKLQVRQSVNICAFTKALLRQYTGLKDNSWKQLYIDAHNGKVRNVVDFVAEHSYRVVPLNFQDPTQKYEIVHEPADYSVSQSGWHYTGGKDTTQTSGNNAIVYKYCRPNLSPPYIDELNCVNTTTQSSPDNNYEYPQNPDKEPTNDQNINAARVNAFYIVNAMHDITYHYGFTENAYNFQNDNFGKGGKGEDRIQVSVQDGSGAENANFATPPDGQPGQMRMFLWVSTALIRDSALQNDIVVHEFTHGVSNRMTGGGTGGCLQATEASGLGEGWSDAMADITEVKTNPIPDFTTGSYVMNTKTGARSYPYSTDKKTNPLTYSSLVTKKEVHQIGEVWATMLHELLAALVEKYGFSDDLGSSSSEMKDYSHLMIDGFQLQPCNPTFISARDAIIQADACRYGGENKCLIWKAFAKRGLGMGAKEGAHSHTGARRHTHRSRSVGPNGVNLVSYHPPSVFETYGIDGAGSTASRPTPEELAKSFLMEKLGVPADSLSRHSGYTSDVVSYEYFYQVINGIPISNAVANVAIKDGKVVSYGASFIKPRNVASRVPTLALDRAIALAEEITSGKWNQQPAGLKYTLGDDGSCYLTYAVQVQGISDGSWKQLFIDAHDGQVRNTVDFVADASYQVVPLDHQDPTQSYTIVKDPQDKVASPHGWYSKSLLSKPDTSGNNVASYKGSLLATTSQSASYQYHYPYDPNQEPDTQQNVNAAVVNAFYVVNAMHDLTYKFGFTEKAFNFQNDNFGKGGKELDRVLVSVQDASGMNNANFATPPDGASGQMRMYLWDRTTPKRDGALENDIIVHEFTHGVSNRMTGGGTGDCLSTTESGGMGEGWSDAMADITEAKTEPIPDFTLGSYVTNNPKGIRSYPYSTDMNVNPLTYSILNTRNEDPVVVVHAIGELWALMLHELLAALVDKCGLDTKLDPSTEAGNSVLLHLMMDGLATQPCNPTFISARDAIIQADANRYKGKYKCTIWKAFAKRGLGKNAKAGVYQDDNNVPYDC
ncbi:unnamed protein product [Rhizoctonia solani]|uniref:FTP domain-containing protein n=1 Tax=Rhizoctonia solani TaxID=456999 RepID=A0A8H2XVI6_9AGAM|nr:unnamed protein product [Rhizoctonia solani]